MANFSICVNKQRRRKDGFYQVYIRVAHNKTLAYIKTDKVVSDQGLSAKLDVTDPYICQSLTAEIVKWLEALNRQDIRSWKASDVVAFIRSAEEDLVFSDYARDFIAKMALGGQERNARNYRYALNHLERFYGTTRVKFSQLTSLKLNAWVKSLEQTARAKEQYPVCMRQVWKSAVTEYNDYDRDVIVIKGNPWLKVKIPSADTPEKKAITAEECRRFFSAPLPPSPMVAPKNEVARDVAMMILCLAGINTADLYNLKKGDYYDGILHYRRRKTMRHRTDKAYFEMRVPGLIVPLIEKYRASDGTDALLSFAERYANQDSFCSNVGQGIKEICRSMGLAQEDWYCPYTFRHTWATTAQNDCGATMAEVGFGLNHSQLHRVTRGYVKVDYSPAWVLNEKVVDFIFFSDKPSARVLQHELAQEDSLFRLSPKMLIRAAAFFQGRCLANFEDIGYANIDEVTKMLVSRFPDDVPERSMVQFKIVNMDNGKVYVYEHQKGKGF